MGGVITLVAKNKIIVILILFQYLCNTTIILKKIADKSMCKYHYYKLINPHIKENGQYELHCK